MKYIKQYINRLYGLRFSAIYLIGDMHEVLDIFKLGFC